MGLLIEAVVRVMLKLITGKAVEATGRASGNRVVRLILIVPCLMIAVGIAVSSAFLWTSERVSGAHGLFQYVAMGGPVWVIATPICAVLLALVLVVPVVGRFGIVLLLGAAMMGLTLAAAADFQRGGQYAVNYATVISIVTSMLLLLLTLALSLSDLPPVDSALAPLTMLYWGRLGHLRALSQFGAQRGWRVSGPTGWTSTLTVAGPYDPAHLVTITSLLNLSIGSRASTSYVLSVKMESPADIIAFRISYEPTPRRLLAQVAAGESRMRGKPTIYYYLSPRPEEAPGITQGFMTRLATVVEAGRPYLRSRGDFMHATPFGLRHTHPASYRLTAGDADLEPKLRWMRELCGLLEEVSPRPAVAEPVWSNSGQGDSIWSDGGSSGYWNSGM